MILRELFNLLKQAKKNDWHVIIYFKKLKPREEGYIVRYTSEFLVWKPAPTKVGGQRGEPVKVFYEDISSLQVPSWTYLD